MENKQTYTQGFLNDQSIYTDGTFPQFSSPIPSHTSEDISTREVRTEYSLPSFDRNKPLYSGGAMGMNLIQVINQNTWFVNEIYKDWRYGEKMQDYKSEIEKLLKENSNSFNTLKEIQVTLTFKNGNISDLKIYDNSVPQLKDVNENPDYIINYQARISHEKLNEVIGKVENKKSLDDFKEQIDRWRREPISMPDKYYDRIDKSGRDTRDKSNIA